MYQSWNQRAIIENAPFWILLDAVFRRFLAMGWPGNVIETHEHNGDFKEPVYNLNSGALGVGMSQSHRLRIRKDWIRKRRS